MGLKTDLEAAAVAAGNLEATNAAQATTIAQQSISLAAKDAQIQTLTTQLNDCLNQPPPPTNTPVTVTVSSTGVVNVTPDAGATVTIKNSTGATVYSGGDGGGSLPAGAYTWTAAAKAGFVLSVPSSGSFTVAAAPPPDPTLPQLPDLPAGGVEVAATELIAKLAAGGPGIYKVKPGSATGTLKLKTGQEVWGLAGFDPAPGKMPRFTGPKDPGNTSRFAQGVGGEANPNVDCKIAYIEGDGYHIADPSWVLLAGDQSAKRRLPALQLTTFKNSQFIGLWLHDNGTHMNMGDGCEVIGGLLEYSHHMYLHVSRGTPVTGWKFLGVEARHNNKRRSDGKPVFDKGWERGVKVIKGLNYVVEDLDSHHNNGPGWWNDGNENQGGVHRRLNCYENLDQGIHYEIANQADFIDCVTDKNANPNSLYLSNSRGTATKPLLVKGGSFTNIKIKDNPGRTPHPEHIRIENVTANEIVWFGGPAKPASVVAVNCKNFAGQSISMKIQT